ncbi:efflux RND transporter periplasmic adaptor subunit [Novispirillum sp. DQ9]|uniref:efflux RND transporter periplasmic adaptor subunit n=1 Tax=Novispirillum sp. DQ9 TaxID=3398612 RepID=UPI003C7BB981
MRRRCRPTALVALLAIGLPLAGARAADGGGDIRAQLVPVRATVLSAEIAGRVADLEVREGDRFDKGQKLVGFDCTLHRARLAKAEAQALEARKSQEVAARLDKLGSVSTLEVDVAAARLAAAQAEVSLTRAVVERCTITAPFAGRVADRKVSRHQSVAEGQELLDILDDSALEVEMIVPSRWLAWLAEGLPFTVTVEESGATHPAVLTRLGARIDAVSQSVKVFGRIEAAMGGTVRLMAGMSGTAHLEPPRQESR